MVFESLSAPPLALPASRSQPSGAWPCPTHTHAYVSHAHIPTHTAGDCQLGGLAKVAQSNIIHSGTSAKGGGEKGSAAEEASCCQPTPVPSRLRALLHYYSLILHACQACQPGTRPVSLISPSSLETRLRISTRVGCLPCRTGAQPIRRETTSNSCDDAYGTGFVTSGVASPCHHTQPLFRNYINCVLAQFFFLNSFKKNGFRIEAACRAPQLAARASTWR